MFKAVGPRRLGAAAVMTLLAATTVGIVGVDADTPSRARLSRTSQVPPSGPPCGVESTATIAAVDEVAARRIYAAELHGTETRADIGHVTGSATLLQALAQGNQPAVQSAVHALVYAPGWHIVRLRVLRAGSVVSDIGGPYIIAPVDGALRWHGRTVGRYVMSVQDDLGYLKLESRFIGVPMEIYRNGRPLMGTVHPVPPSVTGGATISVAGRRLTAEVLSMKAFPTGTLHVALLLPGPAAETTRQSCEAIRLQSWGAIARNIAARFKPLSAHYSDLVNVLRATTGFRAFVTSGSHRIAGFGGPRTLPTGGSVAFGGRRWWVYSFSPSAGVRVYLLSAPA